MSFDTDCGHLGLLLLLNDEAWKQVLHSAVCIKHGSFSSYCLRCCAYRHLETAHKDKDSSEILSTRRIKSYNLWRWCGFLKVYREGKRIKSKRSPKIEKKQWIQAVWIRTNNLLPICRFLTWVSCVTHQEVLLTKHLPSNIVEGLPTQPATCTCTHTHQKE